VGGGSVAQVCLIHSGSVGERRSAGEAVGGGAIGLERLRERRGPCATVGKLLGVGMEVVVGI
jgi:hypothetical protein